MRTMSVLLLTLAASLNIVLAGVPMNAHPTQVASQNDTTSAPTEDAARGRTLYEGTYKCYACHGYSGETGVPRLVPMSRTESSFVAYLRKPSTPQMPAFADVPEQDLADVYAYIRSRKPESPSVEDTPLLNEILQEVNQR